MHQPALTRHGGAETVASASAQTDDQIEQFIRNHADTIYHPVGTCRMGPDGDPMAVVDAQLRVRGVQALRVIDASVMPQVVGGNTNAPVIMMAEKAVDMIRRARETAPV
jgi:choline dehydrogenase-like flavoprotein